MLYANYEAFASVVAFLYPISNSVPWKPQWKCH